MTPLSSPEARSLMTLDADERVRFLRAARGGYVDASTTGWEDGHYLWGPVDVMGDPFPLFRLQAEDSRLLIAPTEPVPELVPWEAPKDGVYLAVDGGNVTGIGCAETDTASILYMTFLINPGLVFSAKDAAIAVTWFDADPDTHDLEAEALQAAA